jgi:hypothetical protein
MARTLTDAITRPSGAGRACAARYYASPRSVLISVFRGESLASLTSRHWCLWRTVLPLRIAHQPATQSRYVPQNSPQRPLPVR